MIGNFPRQENTVDIMTFYQLFLEVKVIQQRHVNEGVVERRFTRSKVRSSCPYKRPMLLRGLSVRSYIIKSDEEKSTVSRCRRFD